MRHRATFLLLPLLTLGCNSMTDPPTEKAEPTAPKQSRSEFAADRAPRDVAEVPFDAKRALGYIEELCKIGTRISGSDGMRKQQEMLKKHFEDLGGKVRLQEFKATQRSVGRPTDMANLIVSWHPDRANRVILCTHYDTRPIADQEEDPRRWREPFLSANDGGSGVALLMELGRHMKDQKTTVGVDFVFFDGEEFIYQPKSDEYFFGSKHFADDYRRDHAKYKYVAAILFDMIAGKNPRFPIEMNSWFDASQLVNEIWKTADESGCRAFQSREGPQVQDDHLALNRAGIPAIDIIDFDYKHWHRLTDVPANCSTEGLEQVARVLTTWLQRK
jgi:hypothetical protein